MAVKHFLETQKTARYFTHHTLSDQTETIWILIHGYAQTAENMISGFETLDARNFLIAPEGLNKFYSKGIGGVPVANWMTSLDRETEIKDYICYLNNLYETLHFSQYPKAKIVVLGFSQGVATGSRWVQATNHRVDLFLMVAGDIGNEMHKKLPTKFDAQKKAFFIGDSDSLIQQENVNLLKGLLGKHTPFYTFAGKHEINADCLKIILEII